MTGFTPESPSGRRLFEAALHAYLEKARRENAESRVWIKQPGNFISVVAILISLMSVGYQIRKDINDGIKSDLDKLSSVVSDLTKIDSDMTLAAASNPAAISYLAMSSNNRRIALLAEADRLIEEVGDRAPIAQLAVLGPDYMQINDFDSAIKYLTLLTRPPANKTEQLDAWRSIAVAYSYEGQAFADRTREAFANAVKVFANPTDAGSLSLVTEVYIEWAKFERDNRNYGKAATYFMNAIDLSQRLPCPMLNTNPNFKDLLAELQDVSRLALAAGEKVDPQSNVTAKVCL